VVQPAYLGSEESHRSKTMYLVVMIKIPKVVEPLLRIRRLQFTSRNETQSISFLKNPENTFGWKEEMAV